MSSVRAKIVAAYEQHRRRFLNDGKREADAGVREQAVEAYVRYLLASPRTADVSGRQRVTEFLTKARALTPAALDKAL